MSELTVKELLEKLKDVNPDLPIETEGCDCDGGECNVIVSGQRVYITRNDRESAKQEETK